MILGTHSSSNMGRRTCNSPDLTVSATYIVNNKGKRLFCKYWEPEDEPKALVFIAHGYAEHCLLYEKLARALASNSFYAFSHDHIGHGQSEGHRAHISSFQDYVDDLYLHADFVRAKFPKLECFICGHSMGGAMSILAVLERTAYFKGAVLIGPAVATNPHLATPFKVAVAKMLRSVVPQFPIGSFDMSLVCSSPENVKIMEEDPLRYHGYAKAAFGASLIEACQEVQRKIHCFKLPFAIYQGEDDKICMPQGAVMMYEKAASADKSIKMYPKAYHSLLFEPNGIAEQVVEDILEWIIARA